MKKYLGQFFFVGLEGLDISKEEEEFIVKNHIGGVVLFARNVESPQQVHALCQKIQSLRHKTDIGRPYFIAIDMEGGRVHRLPKPFTQWPSAKHLGEKASTSFAFDWALAMGTELNAVGINMNFAPCVDLFTNPENKVIGDRALSSDPELVSSLASSLVRGYTKANVIACPKHFPGHGNTFVDSHEELPCENLTLEEIEKRELIPFQKLCRTKTDLLMTAHILFKNIDKEFPVTLSKIFLQDILRTKLGFRNLVISDDLDMKALTHHYDVAQIPIHALKAGCDFLLYCQGLQSPSLALKALRTSLDAGSLSEEFLEKSLQKITNLKARRLGTPDPKSFDEIKPLIGHPLHQKLANT